MYWYHRQPPEKQRDLREHYAILREEEKNASLAAVLARSAAPAAGPSLGLRAMLPRRRAASADAGVDPGADGGRAPRAARGRGGTGGRRGAR